MKRRHLTSGILPFPFFAIFLLIPAFLLLPISPVSARNAETAIAGMASIGHAVPLMKPIVEPDDYADSRALHFIDPVDVTKAKMTSGFGWRVHPVLKTRKMHKGVDYAAPKGTPVHATEDGVVGMAGWRGNYGKLVTIKHAEHVETFYAHLSGFAPGIRPGATVKKGEVIGYIGRTGLATGNHLYYEVVVANERIDPLADDLNEQVNVLAARVTRPEGRFAEGRGLTEAR
ncbi:M23 family metallopeptidase [Parvibaculum sp.]|uniref:M23 family metallopeptidase n=1 Tax=Parvibaculum sp. TaxID=2024848 RepID=UPI0027305F94|nr:M23 family metallopeptidase [Parvibaculum sp.]MDP1628036.1 M23 family metallopeptidase [Parvibaculum sp.]MDP2151035.1 M23 family metallopeptidase [Parvibaculum sp.]MDP3328502.1 M23 family metallopeptidase [Parvibaculum sp.]